jgi:hypothetical protein
LFIGGQMTLFVFLSAAAMAWIISTRLDHDNQGRCENA